MARADHNCRIHLARTRAGRGGVRRGVAPRVGKPRPLDLIERIDHGSISSIEVLELLLYFGKVSQSAGRMAQELLEHFGSLGAILATDPGRLIGFLNGDRASVYLLKAGAPALMKSRTDLAFDVSSAQKTTLRWAQAR